MDWCGKCLYFAPCLVVGAKFAYTISVCSSPLSKICLRCSVIVERPLSKSVKSSPCQAKLGNFAIISSFYHISNFFPPIFRKHPLHRQLRRPLNQPSPTKKAVARLYFPNMLLCLLYQVLILPLASIRKS